MPFLTKAEFEGIVPKMLAQQLCPDQDTFNLAQASAAQDIVTMTGVDEPAAGHEASAPAWTKRPAAHIILWNRIGVVGKIDPELRAWAQSLYTTALATLAENKIKPAAGRVGSSVGTIDGMATW